MQSWRKKEGFKGWEEWLDDILFCYMCTMGLARPGFRKCLNFHRVPTTFSMPDVVQIDSSLAAMISLLCFHATMTFTFCRGAILKQ